MILTTGLLILLGLVLLPILHKLSILYLVYYYKIYYGPFLFKFARASSKSEKPTKTPIGFGVSSGPADAAATAIKKDK